MASTSMEEDVDQGKETDDEIKKIINITNIIIEEAGDLNTKIKNDADKGVINIDISDEISGMLMIVFTCLRKEENDQAGFQKYKGRVAKINDVEISVQTIVGKIKAEGINLNFLVASPIVESMTLFNSFFGEVRTGLSRFKVKKTSYKEAFKTDASGNIVQRVPTVKETTQTISQYGLIMQHIPLLQGITLAPQRRTGVLKSLGPLAQAILMVMEDKYHTELTSALNYNLRMLPMSSEIINCLKEAKSPGSVSGILKELGDILLITPAGSTLLNKIFFPLLFFIYLWNNKEDAIWSFSVAPMLKLYTSATSKIIFKIKSGASGLLTSEAVFHAMFGTYLQDLGVLQQITNHGKWHQRRDMNSIFSKRSEKPEVVFEPIAFKYVPKRAQALFTKCLRNIDQATQTTSRPSFSGFRRRMFSQEFLAYLTTGKNAIHFSDDPMHLFYALRKTKDSLTEEKFSVKLKEAGMKHWEELRGGVWMESTFVPVLENIIFFG